MRAQDDANRNLLLLGTGQFVSQIGTQLFVVAVLLWLKQVTESATLIGLVLAAGLLPAAVLAPWGGALADRYPRRRVLMVCDALGGLAVLVLAAVMFLQPASPTLTIAGIFAVAVVVGGAGAAFLPAATALVPELVGERKVSGANSVLQGSVQLGTLLGQGLGGLLFRLWGAPLLAVLDALSFFVAAASTALVRVPKTSPAASPGPPPSTRGEVRDGLRYVRSHAGMRRLFYFAAAFRFIVAPSTLLFPFYVERHLQATADWYGFLLAGFGVGALMGYVLAGTLRLQGTARAQAVTLALLLTALGYASLGWVTSAGAALVVVFAAGILNGVASVEIVTAFQLGTPNEYRGRVFGLMNAASQAVVPVALLLAGLVSDLAQGETALLFVACGSVLAVLAVLLGADAECRRFLAALPAPAPSSAPSVAEAAAALAAPLASESRS